MEDEDKRDWVEHVERFDSEEHEDADEVADECDF